MRRAIAASTVTAAIVAGAAGGPVLAGDDERDKNSLLAEAQFQIFILTGTDFLPSDVTCTRPPVRDIEGQLVCYALIKQRITIAAIATPESPGSYEFTPLNKIDPADLERPSDRPDSPEPPVPEDQSAIDEAVIASMESAVADADGLAEVLLGANEEIVSIDEFTFDQSTMTLLIEVTTDAFTSTRRDAVAFSVTDIIAYLWEAGEPLRSDAATIQPTMEVTVDGSVYASPFDVMVQVAEYEIDEEEWLELITDTSSIRASKRPPADRSNEEKAAARVSR